MTPTEFAQHTADFATQQADKAKAEFIEAMTNGTAADAVRWHATATAKAEGRAEAARLVVARMESGDTDEQAKAFVMDWAVGDMTGTTHGDPASAAMQRAKFEGRMQVAR